MSLASNTRPLIPVILGPTASGKTAVGIELALQLGAEIISADSRQVFKELTIGSAKPTRDELKRVKHHFIDEISLTEHFDAGLFANAATVRIKNLLAQEKKAIVVGGSTLYLEGLIKGFAKLPKQNKKIRQELETELQKKGAEAMYLELKEQDPEHAKTLDPTKTQRLIRSLEIIRLSGKTLSELYKEQAQPDDFTFKLFGLNLNRNELYSRINERTEKMFSAGFLEEAKQLFERYGQKTTHSSINALATVGYKELFAYFNHELTLSEAKTLIKQHTRNYAKRQMTFFRNRLEIEWIDSHLKSDSPNTIAQKIVERMQ